MLLFLSKIKKVQKEALRAMAESPEKAEAFEARGSMSKLLLQHVAVLGFRV